MTDVNRFVELAAVNVNEHVEKKGSLSYLSWAWAVDQLLRRDPAASWSYGEPVMYGNTMMVYCTVTAFGLARTMQLPVMDHRNKAIANPDAFQANTAMQRCLVKAIALHGLGLYIYAGEDLPAGEDAEPTPVDRIKAATMTGADVNREAFEALGDEGQAYIKTYAEEITRLHDTKGDVLGYLEAHTLDAEEKMALWSQLPSHIRSGIKRAAAETKPPHTRAA